MYFLSSVNLIKFLDFLKAQYGVYLPVKKGEELLYKRYTEFSNDIVIGEVRSFEPLKSFFSRAREIVAEGFKDSTGSSMPTGGKPLAIVGVKACDLKSFKIQDYVFQNHDYQDPFYIKNRRDNLIISSDCTSTLETCFCLALGLKPYPREDFDINLSPLTGGFIIEVGSQKGQALIDKNASLFTEAKKNFLLERDDQRQRVIMKVEKNIKDNNIPYQDFFKGVIEKNYESDIWADEAQTCVECGACNTICPTCHCFLLYDQKDEEKMVRLRLWDSCLIKDFARVAGGANPREKLWMRLRNRFEKKFDFFPKVAEVYACTGCGRCISACPGKIDIRKVLKRLVSDG